jgi:hypothetical protein
MLPWQALPWQVQVGKEKKQRREKKCRREEGGGEQRVDKPKENDVRRDK